MIRGLVADAGEAPQGPHPRRGRRGRGQAVAPLHHRPPAAGQVRSACSTRSCARVALSQSATPPALEDVQARDRAPRRRDRASSSASRPAARQPRERLADLKSRKEAAEATPRRAREAAREGERSSSTKIRERARGRRSRPTPAATAPPPTEAELAQADRRRTRRSVQGENAAGLPGRRRRRRSPRSCPGWTGIPLGKMVRDEIKTVLQLEDRLDERVVGQDHALEAIAQRIRTARADLADPRRPHRRVPARRPLRRRQDRDGHGPGRHPLRRRPQHGRHQHVASTRRRTRSRG